MGHQPTFSQECRLMIFNLTHPTAFVMPKPTFLDHINDCFGFAWLKRKIKMLTLVDLARELDSTSIVCFDTRNGILDDLCYREIIK